MRRPYLLQKRGKYWYYRLCHELTFHSTGQTTQSAAVAFAQSRLEGHKKEITADRLHLLSNKYDYNLHLQKLSLETWATCVWKDLQPRDRLAVFFAHHRGTCHYCGKRVTLSTWRKTSMKTRATIDHLIPLVGGGSDSFDNTILSCQTCNSEKGSANYEDFIEMKELQATT